MAALCTCRILRDWFERNPAYHLHIHYCPSHSGIEENEAVDADVCALTTTLPYALPPMPPPIQTSYSYAKSAITERAVGEWEEMAVADPKRYFGHAYFRHPAFRQLRHTRPIPLKRLGGRPVLVARFVRCVTNHAPTGWYRDRFRTQLREPTLCTLHNGPPAYHTCEHVLFDCDHYTCKYRHSSIEDLLGSLDPFYDILEFLKDNPMALSFEDLPGGAPD
ncbi:hypothetical protein C8Q77DRAFT_1220062 [Trametes polyzona]|nr:hypothetical protein C8Q77DRAFT_1220062 [Trametes polyzona]